jgi:septum formation protein
VAGPRSGARSADRGQSVRRRGRPAAAGAPAGHPEIILASASPRRAALLRQIGLPFRVSASDAGEEPPERRRPQESPEAFAVRLAVAKARTVAARLRGGLVIGADTVVVGRGKLLGKPRDGREARSFLLRLAGRRHRVATGVAVIQAGTGRLAAGVTSARVRMRAFGAEEAARYVATGEPLDKAGAYGIQGRGALLVEAIEGDYYTVVGLPLVLLAELLGRFGVDVWRAGRRSVAR